jgi:chitinase
LKGFLVNTTTVICALVLACLGCSAKASQNDGDGDRSLAGGTTSSDSSTSMSGGAPSSGGATYVGGSPNTAGSGATESGEHEVVGYFAQWGIYERNYHVKNIVSSGSADRLTVINYAFGNIVNGKCHMVTQLGVGDAYADYQKSYSATDSVSGVADVSDQRLKGNFNQLKQLKAIRPNLKVLISLGGWTWSKGFSDAALTTQSRAELVSSCIDLYIRGNLPVLEGDPAGGVGAAANVFDGIDIDWEYPGSPGNDGTTYRAEDTTNFTALLAEFRTQLDAIDRGLLLTIAAPAGQDKIAKIEASKLHATVNWMNLMTYDMHGASDATGPTNFHAPLYASAEDPTPGIARSYSIDGAVQAYLDAGVPNHKIVVGVPFYGRGWTNVPNQNHGLYQSSQQMQAAPGTYEAGIEDYKVLKALGATNYRDDTTKAFWTFDGTTFWSYDDPTAILTKMAYVKRLGLRGAMAWELDGDTLDGELLGAIVKGLK